MEIVNVVRFKVSPDQEQEMRDRRTALIEATRPHGGGPLRTILTRVDEETWMDLWHWPSEDTLKSAQAAQLPEAKAAFALVEYLDGTTGRIAP
ncbi:hypothetical protein [Actinophytocola sp. KF-1]